MKISGRKAISPVLATVILIAITLVAGVAIAGFAFGLFGSLGTTANLQLTSTACSKTGCEFVVSNSGSGTSTITGWSIPGIGAGTTFNATTTIGPNSVGNHFGFAFSLSGNKGQTVTGQLTQTNGPALPFTATVTG